MRIWLVYPIVVSILIQIAPPATDERLAQNTDNIQRKSDREKSNVYSVQWLVEYNECYVFCIISESYLHKELAFLWMARVLFSRRHCSNSQTLNRATKICSPSKSPNRNHKGYKTKIVSTPNGGAHIHWMGDTRVNRVRPYKIKRRTTTKTSETKNKQRTILVYLFDEQQQQCDSNRLRHHHHHIELFQPRARHEHITFIRIYI